MAVPTSARGLRVLLVDHDTPSVIYTKFLLRQHSYKVTAIKLASDALFIIGEGQYDLVLADVNMPDMDCFKFLELLRNIPIILMSSVLNKDLVTKSLNEGASHFLRKPVRDHDIVNVWQHVFREKKLLRKELEIAHNDKRSIHQDKKSMFCENRSQRMRWTPERHQKFLKAISILGEGAQPREILKLMNEPDLTYRHVGSHLQKYRERKKRESVNCTAANNPPMLTKPTCNGEHGSSQSMNLPNTASSYTGINAETTKFTPPIPVSRPWLNLDSPVHNNLEALERKLQSANLFSINFQGGVMSADSGNGTYPCAMSSHNVNGKGKQPMELEGYNEYFSNIENSPTATGNQQQQLNVSTELDMNINQFPLTFTGINEETSGFSVGQTGCSSSNCHNKLTEGFHDGGQELNATAMSLGDHCDMNLLEGDDEIEDFINSQLTADDNDWFS